MGSAACRLAEQGAAAMGQPGQWPSGHAGMVADDGCTRALARGAQARCGRVVCGSRAHLARPLEQHRQLRQPVAGMARGRARHLGRGLRGLAGQAADVSVSASLRCGDVRSVVFALGGRCAGKGPVELVGANGIHQSSQQTAPSTLRLTMRSLTLPCVAPSQAGFSSETCAAMRSCARLSNGHDHAPWR